MGFPPSIHRDGDNGRFRLIHNCIVDDGYELYSSDENQWLKFTSNSTDNKYFYKVHTESVIVYSFLISSEGSRAQTIMSCVAHAMVCLLSVSIWLRSSVSLTPER